MAEGAPPARAVAPVSASAKSRPRRGRVVTLLAASAALSFPAAAPAHAFLVRSNPSPGARLATAPPAIVLTMDQPFVSSSARLTVRRVNGAALPLPRAQVHGPVIRQPFPRSPKGVFVVSWRLLSDDGHVSQGTFAFAVASTEAIPGVQISTAETSWDEVLPSWVLFLGLALAFGGLVSERLVWRAEGAPVIVGIILAGIGATAQLLLVAGDRRGGGLLAGLRPSAVWGAAGTRPGYLSALVLLTLALATVTRLARAQAAALALLSAGLVFVALRGHPGTSGAWWAVGAIIVHLAAAAAWIGALAHLVLVVLRAPDGRSALSEGVHRYSRLAPAVVALVLTSGLLTMLSQIRTFGEIADTRYGRLLIVKSILVAGALGIAALARQRALAPRRAVRLGLLRPLTEGEWLVLAGVFVAAAVLVNVAPPHEKTATAALAASSPGEPLTAPPDGPFVSAREDGDLAVGLAVKPAGRALVATVTVIGPDAQAPGGVLVAARLVGSRGEGRRVASLPCGGGCYRARLVAPGKPRALLLVLERSGRPTPTLRYPLPSAWPPKTATVIVRRATRTFEHLRSVVFEERLASSARNAVNTTWTLEAPASLSYRIHGGAQAIVINSRRWDRERGGRWQESQTPLLRQPTPFWIEAPQQAALLGTAEAGGRPVWIATFLQPQIRAWFTVWIDRKTYRPLELEMIAPAHFMHHRYREFDSAPPIEPPRASRLN